MDGVLGTGRDSAEAADCLIRDSDDLRGGRTDAFRQTSLVSAGCVLLDHALLNRPVDNAECFGQQGLGIFRFPGSKSRSHAFDLSLQPVPIHLIDQPPALALPVSFNCRWMVCHQFSSKNVNDNTCYNPRQVTIAG
jgi:hypothetical protein